MAANGAAYQPKRMTMHKKALKQKDIIKLQALEAMHPADLSVAQADELKRLQERRNHYGEQI